MGSRGRNERQRKNTRKSSKVLGPSPTFRHKPGRAVRPHNFVFVPKEGPVKGPSRPNGPSWNVLLPESARALIPALRADFQVYETYSPAAALNTGLQRMYNNKALDYKVVNSCLQLPIFVFVSTFTSRFKEIVVIECGLRAEGVGIFLALGPCNRKRAQGGSAVWKFRARSVTHGVLWMLQCCRCQRRI